MDSSKRKNERRSPEDALSQKRPTPPLAAQIFDIPVFWPILLIYFIALTFMTLRKQIAHMIKHKYVPWSWGKTQYKSKDPLNAPGSGGKGLSL